LPTPRVTNISGGAAPDGDRGRERAASNAPPSAATHHRWGPPARAKRLGLPQALACYRPLAGPDMWRHPVGAATGRYAPRRRRTASRAVACVDSLRLPFRPKRTAHASTANDPAVGAAAGG